MKTDFNTFNESCLFVISAEGTDSIDNLINPVPAATCAP